MDGVEPLLPAAGGASPVFKAPVYTGGAGGPYGGSHPAPYARPVRGSFDYPHHHQGGQPMGRRQPSSSHSRSSSLSISSLSQHSSFAPDDRGPTPGGGALKILPTPGPTGVPPLTSYGSHPNFHPAPLRSTPVRRTFPSLRHAMSHPAFSSSSDPAPRPPFSASGHQYASYHPQQQPGAFPFSPFSAPPPLSARASVAAGAAGTQRLELAPVCPSRVGHALPLLYRDDTPVDWPLSAPPNPADDGPPQVGFDQALAAMDTLMRFLQDQPTGSSVLSFSPYSVLAGLLC
ncbi:hypothetical protein PTTG_11414 [Puccinia triticina 1-1 BBBD Race 1]|uniref:Uncharacterized protein n=1 Tax=Puccinia triticina (isolate 1-1 / race 1 (BBBD)) TaxID=630390 RepID=A0A0C4FDV8_PUCT1|nr:hypothetical protein PTTG_11414 [Puccinia triticina 1-1 BBBD Race 1]